jgi:hypothetical protein
VWFEEIPRKWYWKMDDEIEEVDEGIPEAEGLQINQFLYELEEDDEQFDHPLIHFSSPSSQDQP